MSYNSTAIGTQGFKMEVADPADSPLDYTEVKEVTNFSGLDGQATEIDITHLQSSAKEKLIGLQDWGDWNLDINFISDDDGQSELRAAKADREKRSFRATLSDGKTLLFQAYVKSAPISGGVDDKVGGSFSLSITGDVTGTVFA